MSFWNSARIVLKWLPSRNRGRAPGKRAQPDLVVLGGRAGHTPSPAPPVRIFVGTELAQHRAERIFVWSIERVRDPARVYEIHLMKELDWFDRSRWLTGFSNYRFAIPVWDTAIAGQIAGFLGIVLLFLANFISF